MIKKLLQVIIIFGCLTLQSQDLNKICVEKMQKIDNLIKTESYFESEKVIDASLSCKNLDEIFFLNVEKTFNYINLSSKSDDKLKYINKLVEIYDLYDANFPKNNNRNAVKKSVLLYDNKTKTNLEIFNVLDKTFKTKKTDFVNALEINLYFKLFVEIKKSFQTNNEINDLLDTFFEINLLINKNQIELNEKLSLENLSANDKKNLQNNILAFNITKKNINAQIARFLTCDNLSSYYESNKEKNVSNDYWLKSLTEKMFEKNCSAKDNFNKLTIQSHKINATSKSSYYLAFSYLYKNDYEKAIQFFDESAEKETNLEEKAKIYYTIATTVFGINNKSKCKEYLEKAIETDSKFGQPYVFLSELYKSSIQECTKNDFEKKAFNWIIINTYNKANIADPNLIRETEGLIAESLKNIPTKLEIKKAKMSDKQLTFDCWFRETILIPKK